MRRQAEMEESLKQVRGTDFTGIPHEIAGIGCNVKISRPDGRNEEYNILGEWDYNAELNIVSSNSLIAQSIIGHGTGETVKLPAGSPDKTEDCIITGISGLPEVIRHWIRPEQG